MHLPVLSPEWIKEAWRLALECDHVLCTSSEIYEPYVVRVYTKYVCSIISLPNKLQIQEANY